MPPPGLGEASQPGGRGDPSHGCDPAVGQVERHDTGDPVADHEEKGGSPVDERVVDVRRAAGKTPFGGCGLEPGPYHRGDALLLEREFLVAADIIRTVAISPTFASVGVLAVIVLVRTFHSFSLEVELEGRWPWQQGPPGARTRQT
ncbi:DUF1622 domain-containing protein [Nonomuraea sp. NPDC049419]|uniref:DUF1622 domain-containing protein n=1 Tax=Nonomuraea sp. NPDC049419 TaxID=3155772 RepID=UPI003414C1E9